MRQRALHGIIVLACLLGALLVAANAAAQDTIPIPPPTIIRFESDVKSISLQAAEEGIITANLRWNTVGVGGEYRLVLEAYTRRVWSPLVDINATPLEPNGVYVVRVQHLCGFCEPTYRLSIVNQRGQIVDQKIVMIPFTEPAPQAAPSIASFTTGVERIEANSLAQQTARVTVLWDVENRTPLSNLVFEQVLDDGRVVSVELPRTDLWVASRGQGEVAPVLPVRENYVQLRLRVVDVIEGTVYDEATLIVPIVGAVTAPVVQPVAPIVFPTFAPADVIVREEAPLEPPPPQIQYLTVNPQVVDRGDTVTLSWSVTNARSVFVSRLSPTGAFADFLPDPPLTGTWTVTLPSYHVDNATFYLIAVGANDQQVSSSATVQVRCPFTYFFGDDPAAACPLSGMTQISAAYQPFERGFMLWRGDTRQIYVFYNDGKRTAVFADTWEEGEPINLLNPPPEGAYAPERGFGKLWSLNPEVSGGLGWATGPELAYSMRMQQSGDYRYARAYYALPDGRIVYTVENTWDILNT